MPLPCESLVLTFLDLCHLGFTIYQVTKIDGRIIGDGQVGPVTRKLQEAYGKLTADAGVPIPTYQSGEL